MNSNQLASNPYPSIKRFQYPESSEMVKQQTKKNFVISHAIIWLCKIRHSD